MFAYRIEDKKGFGPYHSSKTGYWRSGFHTHSSGRIMPHEDIKEWNSLTHRQKNKYIFGFKSLAQLQAWFRPEEIVKLDRIGFKIRRVKARNVIHGKVQVAFKRSK